MLLFGYIIFIAALYTRAADTMGGFSSGSMPGPFFGALAIVFLLFECCVVLYLADRHRTSHALASLFLFAIVLLGSKADAIFLLLAAPALFLLAPFYWLVEVRGKGLAEAAGGLLLSRKGLLLNIGAGIAGAIIIGIAMLALASLLAYFGLADQAIVRDKVAAFPWYALLAAVTVIPLAEEIFFRGFLMGRIGVLGSSLVFGLAHWNYGSVAEIIAAVAIGLMLCYITKFRRSLVAPTVAHALFNAASLFMMNLI